MKTKDILNQQVSVLKSTLDNTPTANLPLNIVLNDLSIKWKDHIQLTREALLSGNEQEYKSRKLHTPCWLVHGTVEGKVYDRNMSSFNNIIALDIDVKEGENDNVDIDTIRYDLFNKPYTIAALKSVSGRGIYVLVAVEDHNHNKGYYTYFGNLLKKKYGIELDMKATNPARKRILSWEEDLESWIKPADQDIIPWKLYINEKTDTIFQTEVQEPHNVRRNTQTSLFSQFSQDEQKERTHQAMWALLNSGFNAQSRGYWYHIGKDLAAFPDGKNMFMKLCANWGPQEQRNIESTWKSCEKEPNPIDDDMHKRWQGLAKNRLGTRWWDKETS